MAILDARRAQHAQTLRQKPVKTPKFPEAPSREFPPPSTGLPYPIQGILTYRRPPVLTWTAHSCLALVCEDGNCTQVANGSRAQVPCRPSQYAVPPVRCPVQASTVGLHGTQYGLDAR